MVNIQVYEKDANKKIETKRCEENETMVNLEKLEKKYGATEHSHIEKDNSKKTTMIRYYRESETHTIIISMSEWQAERVNEYLADYWEFVRLFDDEETENEGDEKMTENTIAYTVQDRLSRNIMDEDFTMWDAEGNTNFYIIEEMACDGTFFCRYSVYMGKKYFGSYKTVRACKIAVTKTFAQDENGNGLIPREEIKFIIVNTIDDYSEDFETAEEFVTAIAEKIEKFLEQDLECEADGLRRNAQYKGESFSSLSQKIETGTGDETMTENTGYDRDFVLLEAGEFECGGRTFTYEGEPITVGDVLDRTIGMDFPIASDRDYQGHFGIAETGHIYCMVTTYMRDVRHLLSWEQIVYAPNFSDIYATASDFVESRIELLQTYQPTKEFQEKVDHCTYKGRLFKDLVKMSADELEAVDNSSASFSTSDVQAYLDFLLAQAQDPKTWVKDLVITEDHIDFHIRNKINWGVDYCEKYCSPSLAFFRVAEKMYQDSKADRSAQDDDDVVVEFECVHGSASFQGYAYKSELDDDEPLHFYDRNGGSQTSLQNAHFEGSEDDVFALKDAFCSDFLFTEFLYDYADKTATIKRDGYVLHINGGQQVALEFEKVGNFSTDSCDASYDVRIIPSYDICIDADLLDDLVSRVEQTWNSDANARVEDGLIICEFDKHFFDDDADFSDEIDEMTGDYDAIICDQVIRNLGAYGTYQLALTDFFMRGDDKRVFDDALIRNASSLFEEQLEEYKLSYLLSLSDDDLKRLVVEDIDETFCRD